MAYQVDQWNAGIQSTLIKLRTPTSCAKKEAKGDIYSERLTE